MRPIPTLLAVFAASVLIACGARLAINARVGRALIETPPSDGRRPETFPMPPVDHVIGGGRPVTEADRASLSPPSVVAVQPPAIGAEPMANGATAASATDASTRPMLDPRGVDPAPTR